MPNSYERLSKLLAAFKSKRALVVGDLMLDRSVYGSVERINPEAPVPILRTNQKSKKTVATGGAGNVAKNIAALGGKATLVGIVGLDSAGSELMKAADREGYVLCPVSHKSWITVTKTRFLEQRGHHLLRVDEEPEDLSLPVEAAKRVIRDSIAFAKEADAVLVSDYAKGVVTRELAGEMLAITKHLGIPLHADLKPSSAAYFRGADTLSPNEAEARAYIPGLGKDDPLEYVAMRIGGELETTVFVTAGERGMCVSAKGNPAELVPQQHKVEVADTSGCGDTAAAVILLAHLCGANVREAAALANAAAAVVASKIGAVAPTPDEVRDMLQRI